MVPLFLPDTPKQDEIKAQRLHQPGSFWKVIRSGWGCWRVSLKQPKYSHFTFVVLFLQVCGRSSKLPSSLVVILLFQPQVWAVLSTFVTAHTTPQNGAHLSLSVPPIRKTDAAQNSCGTSDGKALHGLGSLGDSWGRHKQIQLLTA